MTLRDLIVISSDDLRLRKLRSFLTVSGVIIAVAAFVAMLSFGAGNLQYFSDVFNSLGLASTIVVYPPDKNAVGDIDSIPVLNEEAVTRISNLLGVLLAYPYDAFEIKVATPDTEFTTNAHALPRSALEAKLFSRMVAGQFFDNDTASQVIITDLLSEDMGYAEPDSAVGVRIVISADLTRIDSGLVRIFSDRDGSIRERLKDVWIDSLASKDYRINIIRQELKAAMGRFLNGYMTARETISDTFTISGIIDRKIQGGRLKIQPVIMAVGAASGFNPGGLDGDPARLFMALQSGANISFDGGSVATTYPQVTVITRDETCYQQVRDSIDAIGYRTFSFVDQFKEIRDFFLYYDLALGMIGMIALVVASLGIINTMIMSIMERTREIGVLLSLGADQSDIRKLFLVQAGVIGIAGAIFGIILGWAGTRLVSEVAKAIMESRGLQPVEFFALPLWLILAALAVGFTISLLAGLYPAARAARINPVEALRSE